MTRVLITGVRGKTGAPLPAFLAARPGDHVEVTTTEAVAEVPEGVEREEFVWTLERLRDGVFSGVTDTVEAVTGDPHAASPT